VNAYVQCRDNGLNPMYYAGGTEIVTFCRAHKIQPGALIDIKHIPECLEMGERADELVFGSAFSLNAIIERNVFPLLSRIAEGIADHTVRNRLTLGGNLAGRLPYRETALACLLSDAIAQIAGPVGTREIAFSELCQTRLLLEDGEFLAHIRVSKALSRAPWFFRRKTASSRVDYPIVSAAFLQRDGNIRMAVGGAFFFPVRASQAEAVLNDTNISLAERPAKVLEAIAFHANDDFRASSEYRFELLKNMLHEALEWSGI
jgi:xanthine dehydrogenase FAD-binding subunit